VTHDIEHIFDMLAAHLYVIIEEMSIQVLSPFLIGLFRFFLFLNFRSSSSVQDDQLYSGMICKCFLFHRLPFTLVTCVL
jgi:hypothetical protein